MGSNEEQKFNLTPPKRPSPGKRALVASAAGLLILLVIGAFVAQRRPDPAPARGSLPWTLASEQRPEHSALPDEALPLGNEGLAGALPSRLAGGGGGGQPWRERLRAQFGALRDQAARPGRGNAPPDRFEARRPGGTRGRLAGAGVQDRGGQ
ncbi:MAG: hypothetical protein HY553_12905, partial [Elusimicrobia bacterium]|nr:hypothetical protein [Elusimicrobiota bacterium]